MALRLNPFTGEFDFGGGSLTNTDKANSGIPWTHELEANPSVRPDGSPLVVGDRIWVPPNVANAGLWAWDGLYWIEPVEKIISGTMRSASNSDNFARLSDNSLPPGPILIVKRYIDWFISPTVDASNYWRFEINFIIGGGESTRVQTEVAVTTTQGPFVNDTPLFFANTTGIIGVRLWAFKVGSPSNAAHITETVIYKRAR